jgi:hypothetical protein
MNELYVTLMTRDIQVSGLKGEKIVEEIIAQGTLSVLPERFHIIKIADRTFTVTDIEWDLAIGLRPNSDNVESLSDHRHHQVKIILSETTE